MNVKNKKIGIWGFGVVGASTVRYLHPLGAQLQVLDNRNLTPEEQALLTAYNIPWFNTDALPTFLEHNELIVPSPGIDLRPYAHYQSKWLSELDLFRAAYPKPIIAITGSVGKTSITHLLSTILNTHCTVATGGNIGTGMLDLLATPSDMALLEVSSFQLELCTSFAPDCAIWTNFYPNHLDRHGSEQNYFDAKCAIMRRQQNQQALLPLAVHKKLNTNGVAVFCSTRPTNAELHKLESHTLFFIDNGQIIMRAHGHEQSIIALDQLPEASFTENWLIICSALTLLNIPLTSIEKAQDKLTVPEHRLEKVATINNITFYNDSKSTTPQSTLAALAQLKGKPIRLFIGGISKGINRAPFIAQLHGQVQHVYCFGKECEELHRMCREASIPATCSSTLEEAFELCAQQSAPGEQIVFSPAGASFDLFKDYKERGNRFKELVKNCIMVLCFLCQL